MVSNFLEINPNAISSHSGAGILSLYGSHPAERFGRVAADRGLGHVERGHRWGSAKAERGYQWSPQKKVGGTTLLPIQNAHR